MPFILLYEVRLKDEHLLPTGEPSQAARLTRRQFIISRSVGKNSQILRNPLKFAFWPYLGVIKTPYLGSDVMILYLQLVARNLVIQSAAVRFRSRGPDRWASFIERAIAFREIFVNQCVLLHLDLH